MYNEENNELNEVDTEVTETAESNTDESAKEPIPEELGGVDESVAREIMAEADSESDNAENVEEQKEAENNPNTDNGDDDVLPSNMDVPYPRFKQKVAQVHQLKEEIDSLKAKLASSSNNGGNTETTQPSEENQMNVRVGTSTGEQQNPIVNADIAKQFREAVTREAMRMTGMTKEDVESTEYMDADDSRLQTWNTAYKLAEANVTQKIQEAHNRHIAQQQHMVAMHNESVIRYNNFANEAMQDEHFAEIQDYATNEYFSKQDNADQTVIAGAYLRIQNNVASPQDTMIVRKYFTEAKNDYLRKHGGKSNNAKNTANKIKQGRALPRSSNISGAGNDTGDVSVETLERMLNTTPFEDIPEKYQRMLLGMEPIE